MMVSMSKTNFEENKKTMSNFVIQNKGGFLICSEEVTIFIFLRISFQLSQNALIIILKSLNLKYLI